MVARCKEGRGGALFNRQKGKTGVVRGDEASIPNHFGGPISGGDARCDEHVAVMDVRIGVHGIEQELELSKIIKWTIGL
jgi:hypothetical protein